MAKTAREPDEEPKFIAIGKVLRDARKARKLTQEEMAELLGRTQAQISKWEAGWTLPTTEDVRDVAREYRIRPEQLLPRSEGS